MKQLQWQTLDAAALADLLGGAELESSRAVDGATVYQIRVEGHSQVAIALPGGKAIVVQAAASPTQRRRTTEQG